MVVFLVRKQLWKTKRIVIKLGTTTLIDDNGELNRRLLKELARCIRYLNLKNKEVVIVSSGAIGLGYMHLKLPRSNNMLMNQCAASVGQVLLMNAYVTSFNKYNLSVSQILLTQSNLNHDTEKIANKNLIEKLIELNIVPIINENDPVSTEETTFRDNDMLAGHISKLLNADLLIILSNVDGLYENYETKEVVRYVSTIDSRVDGLVSNKKSILGKGGMMSKLIAADLASNTVTVIANGRTKNVVKKILDGMEIGTLIKLEGNSK